ncbi:MAG TPA: hypothetical protein VG675_00985 [Bryobacteraceae bacterium]|nr:hypothetical protein [Bryobacteraceae bacterium]
MKRSLPASLFTLCAAWGAGLAPYSLECETRTNPLGVDAVRRVLVVPMHSRHW